MLIVQKHTVNKLTVFFQNNFSSPMIEALFSSGVILKSLLHLVSFLRNIHLYSIIYHWFIDSLFLLFHIINITNTLEVIQIWIWFWITYEACYLVQCNNHLTQLYLIVCVPAPSYIGKKYLKNHSIQFKLVTKNKREWKMPQSGHLLMHAGYGKCTMASSIIGW